MRLDVHIEHLVIENPGAGRIRQDRLQAAVQAEIEWQLRARGLASVLQPGMTERPVDGGVLPIAGSRGSEQIGRHIGRAVFRSIAK